MPQVHLLAASRADLPNLAALWHALAEDSPPFRPVLVHAGEAEGETVFGLRPAELGLPRPQIALGVNADGPAERTARTMLACGSLWAARPPRAVVVSGDSDAALAATLVAARRGLRVAHMDAGLRSGIARPEETNRRAIDAVATGLWAPDRDAAANLVLEGQRPAIVGSTAIATLEHTRPRWEPRVTPGEYAVLRLDRTGMLEDPARLTELMSVLGAAAQVLPIVWPIDPGTATRLPAPPPWVRIVPDASHLDSVALLAGARAVICDGGVVQEEASHLGIACLTLLPATERPLTLRFGTNRLTSPERLVRDLIEHDPTPQPVPFWDAAAGQRAAAALKRLVREVVAA